METVQNIKSVHELIEQRANDFPDSPAVSWKGNILSYRELNTKANQLARYLIAEGVNPENLVGICLERSLDLVVGILGILKSGGTYVPIDPKQPIKRIHEIITDTKLSVLITQQSVLDIFPVFVKKICLESEQKKISLFSKNNLNNIVEPNHLAYVIYTSGSTGKPKGVMIRHHSLINAYFGWKKVYELKNNDVHLQMANFSFDVFTGDFVRALCSGAKLVLCPRNILLLPEELYKFMVDEKINFAEFVPTVLRKLVHYIDVKKYSLSFMRILICGSDTWSMKEYRQVKRICEKKTRVINSYGTTEATIDSTYFEESLLDQKYFADTKTVPIGKPFPNTQIYILDEKMNLVPPGEVGEIYIGGEGLAKGYFNDPVLTRQKFIDYPLIKNILGCRLYKTGDQGRYFHEKNIEFLGRNDNQVKVRGIRINLSEIENTINNYPVIKESMVVIDKKDESDKKLIAYVVIEPNKNFNLEGLKEYLKQRFPTYMLPSDFILLDNLPLLPNAKLNRNVFNLNKAGVLAE